MAIKWKSLFVKKVTFGYYSFFKIKHRSSNVKRMDITFKYSGTLLSTSLFTDWECKWNVKRSINGWMTLNRIESIAWPFIPIWISRSFAIPLHISDCLSWYNCYSGLFSFTSFTSNMVIGYCLFMNNNSKLALIDRKMFETNVQKYSVSWFTLHSTAFQTKKTWTWIFGLVCNCEIEHKLHRQSLLHVWRLSIRDYSHWLPIELWILINNT